MDNYSIQLCNCHITTWTFGPISTCARVGASLVTICTIFLFFIQEFFPLWETPWISESYTNTVKVVKCFYFFVRAVYFLAVHLDICRDLTCKRPRMCWGCTLTLHCVIRPVNSHTAVGQAAQESSFTKRDGRFSAGERLRWSARGLCSLITLAHFLWNNAQRFGQLFLFLL